MKNLSTLKEEARAVYFDIPHHWVDTNNIQIKNRDVVAFLDSCADTVWNAAYEQGKKDEYRSSVEALIPGTLRIRIEARDGDNKDALSHIFTKEQIQSGNGKYFRLIIEELAAKIAMAPILKSWILSNVTK